MAAKDPRDLAGLAASLDAFTALAEKGRFEQATRLLPGIAAVLTGLPGGPGAGPQALARTDAIGRLARLDAAGLAEDPRAVIVTLFAGYRLARDAAGGESGRRRFPGPWTGLLAGCLILAVCGALVARPLLRGVTARLTERATLRQIEATPFYQSRAKVSAAERDLARAQKALADHQAGPAQANPEYANRLGQDVSLAETALARANDDLPLISSAIRIEDLGRIATALEAYKKANGAYPKSQGFDGLYTLYGRSGPDWIPGLCPDFLDALPRDPRRNDNPSNQYLYNSNGTDYKLIAHHPEDGQSVARLRPDLIDPARGPSAYGVWTPAAASW